MADGLNLVLPAPLGLPEGGRQGQEERGLADQHQELGEALALFRYGVIAEATRPSLGAAGSPRRRNCAARCPAVWQPRSST
jgi:hypothetical protein